MRVVSLALVAGCIDVARVDIADDPDAMVILALGSANGVTTSARVVTRTERAALSLGEESTFYTFEIAPSDFVKPDGSAFSKSDLDGLRARHLSDELPADFGACGRCLSEFGSAPNVAHAGQSCPPPLFSLASRWRSDGSRLHRLTREELAGSGATRELDEIEAARQSIRIEWPGECACAPVEPPRPTPVFEAIQPSDRPHPLEALAQLEDGTAGGFSIGVQYAVDPAGVSSTTYEVMAGPVIAAGALEAGNAVAFLVALDVGGIGDLEIAHRLFLFEGGAIGGTRSLELSPSFRTRGMKRLFLGGEAKLIAFGNDGSSAAVATCVGSDAVVSCTVHPVTCAVGSILDVASNGESLVAITNFHLAIARWSGAAPEPFDCAAHGEILRTVEGGLGAQPTKVGVAGTRIVLCARGAFLLPFASTAHLFLIDVGPGGLAEAAGSPGPDLGFDAISQRFGCPEVIEIEPGRVEITTPFHVRAVITATAAWKPSRLLDYEQIQDPSRALFVQREEQRAPGYVLYRSGAIGVPNGLGAKVHRRRAGGVAEEIYGPADPRNGWGSVTEVRTHPAGFVALNHRPSHQASLIRFGENGAFRVDDLDVELYSEGESIDRSAVDTMDGSVVVVGVAEEPSGDRPWVRRFDPFAPEAGVFEASLPAEMDGRLRALIEVSPGRFVFATDEGAFFGLSEDRIESIAPEWDDPFTREVETPPFDRATGLDLVNVRDSVGAGGVAWIVGDRFILAARPGNRALVEIERVSPFRGQDAFSTNLVAASFFRVGARCADRAVIGYNTNEDPSLRVVGVHPRLEASRGAAPIGPSSVPVTPHVFEPGEYPQAIRSDLDVLPLAIHVGRDDRPSYLFDRGRLVISGRALTGYLPFPALGSAALDDTIIVAGDDGRLALGIATAD